MYTSLKHIAVVNEKMNEHNGYVKFNVERKLYSNECKKIPQEDLNTKTSKILRTEVSL